MTPHRASQMKEELHAVLERYRQYEHEEGAVRVTSRCTPSRTRAVDVTALSAQAVERRFLALRGLRWAPIGLMIPVMVLLLTERGFSLTEIGATAAAPGLMVLLLELPTGGLADALGRRPVLLLATAIDLVATAPSSSRRRWPC